MELQIWPTEIHNVPNIHNETNVRLELKKSKGPQ